MRFPTHLGHAAYAGWRVFWREVAWLMLTAFSTPRAIGRRCRRLQVRTMRRRKAVTA